MTVEKKTPAELIREAGKARRGGGERLAIESGNVSGPIEESFVKEMKRRTEAREAEAKRRDALTPEQRAYEDRFNETVEPPSR